MPIWLNMGLLTVTREIRMVAVKGLKGFKGSISRCRCDSLFVVTTPVLFVQNITLILSDEQLS
jgi:hypothetical protein